MSGRDVGRQLLCVALERISVAGHPSPRFMGVSHEYGESRYHDRMADRQIPERLRSNTSYLLTEVMRQSSRLAAPFFGAERLRFPHYVTLVFIAETDGLSQRELADALGTDPSDLVTVLDELVDAGMATREVDPQDRRKRSLRVTTAGSTWIEKRTALAAEHDRELCAALPDGGAALRRELEALV
jgi:DNA-binding MarR family transcriptional regulator